MPVHGPYEGPWVSFKGSENPRSGMKQFVTKFIFRGTESIALNKFSNEFIAPKSLRTIDLA